MHALRSECACHRLSKNALRSLGWRHAGEQCSTAMRRGIAGDDYGAASAGDHRGRAQASKLQQRHHIHFEVAPQHGRLDAHEVATGAADGIAQTHTRRCCVSR